MSDRKKTLDDAVARLKAAGDATRARILLCLRGQPLCLDHLTRVLGLAPSTLSAHLKALAGAGLVDVTQEGHWRYYHLPEASRDNSGDELLGWLHRHAGEDSRAVDDASRRTVALAKSDAPVPGFLKPRVLFLCTGNSCRSQMAEGLLRAKAGDRLDVYSAGVVPRAIPRTTYKVMNEIGVDVRKQFPKDVLSYLGHLSIDHLIAVCPDAEARCPVFPGVKNRLCWRIADPMKAKGTGEEQLAVFRKVRDELVRRINAWLKKLDDRSAAGRPPKSPRTRG